MATQFTFGDTFLNQLNRGQQMGQQQAVSKAELQMRAKQLQEEVLTAQLAREQTRLQMSLDQMANQRAEELGDAQVANLESTTEATNFATESARDDREYTTQELGVHDDVSEILGIEPGETKRLDDWLKLYEAAQTTATEEEKRRLTSAQAKLTEKMLEVQDAYAEDLKNLYSIERDMQKNYNSRDTSIKEAWSQMTPEQQERAGGWEKYRARKIKDITAAGYGDVSPSKARERYIEETDPNKFGILGAGKFIPRLAGLFMGLGNRSEGSLLENARVPRSTLVDPEVMKGEEIRSRLSLRQMQYPQYLESYQPGFLRGITGDDPTPGFLQSGAQKFFPYTGTPYPEIPMAPQEEE